MSTTHDDGYTHPQYVHPQETWSGAEFHPRTTAKEEALQEWLRWDLYDEIIKQSHYYSSYAVATSRLTRRAVREVRLPVAEQLTDEIFDEVLIRETAIRQQLNATLKVLYGP